MTKVEEKFSCLFGSPWKILKDADPKSVSGCVVEGSWVEDGSSFRMVVPACLTQPLVDLINSLNSKYAEIVITAA